VTDEAEHINPKDLYLERVFDWANYLYACGPCNGPKSNSQTEQPLPDVGPRPADEGLGGATTNPTELGWRATSRRSDAAREWR
jgi:hypothetical protein